MDHVPEPPRGSDRIKLMVNSARDMRARWITANYERPSSCKQLIAIPESRFNAAGQNETKINIRGEHGWVWRVRWKWNWTGDWGEVPFKRCFWAKYAAPVLQPKPSKRPNPIPKPRSSWPCSWASVAGNRNRNPKPKPGREQFLVSNALKAWAGAANGLVPRRKQN